MYTPKPILKEVTELSPEIQELIEDLSENVHDIWALEKMGNGWEFGEKLDRETKKHPDLIPYSDLTEEIKEYDRKTVLATISYLIEKNLLKIT